MRFIQIDDSNGGTVLVRKNTTTMSKTEFLKTYETLLSDLPWARVPGKLETFMSSCRETITGPLTTWNHDGELSQRAWRAIGGRGRVTLRGLRSLPN